MIADSVSFSGDNITPRQQKACTIWSILTQSKNPDGCKTPRLPHICEWGDMSCPCTELNRNNLTGCSWGFVLRTQGQSQKVTSHYLTASWTKLKCKYVLLWVNICYNNNSFTPFRFQYVFLGNVLHSFAPKRFRKYAGSMNYWKKHKWK